MGLAPIAIGMVGLQFALFVNAMPLLGVDADVRQAGSPARTVGAVGSLLGAVALLFMSFWFIVGAPLGKAGIVPQVQLTFSLISGMYGLLWLGVGITQMLGWDARPLGNAALIAALMQVIAIVVVARWGLNTNLVLIEVVLAIYTAVLLGFWGATHGSFPARAEGGLLLLAVLGTFYLQFWASGIWPVPI